MHHRRLSLLLHALFLLSGAAGLAYQLVWTRIFALGLGQETPAVLAVVAAFFAGLALGGWALDHRVSGSVCPGKWYGALEVVIGIWGLLSTVLLPYANDVAIRWLGVGKSPLWQWGVAFVVPLVSLAPATVALGATLPAIDRLVGSLAPSRGCVASLYATNTLGAVVGTLASTLILMPSLGFRKSLMALALVNLVCGVTVWILEAKWASAPSPQPVKADPSIPSPKSKSGLGTKPNHPWVRWAFLTGLLGIGYEVLVIHVLAQTLENTVYTFAVTLAVYLAGTSLGAALLGRVKATEVPLTRLSVSLAGLGLACLLSLLTLPAAATGYAICRNVFGDSQFGVLTAETTVALAVFGLPTLCMGASFSVLAQSARSPIGGVGAVLGANTLGASLAPVLFGVVGVPALGSKWLLVGIGFAYVASAAWVDAVNPESPFPWGRTPAPAASASGARRDLPARIMARPITRWALAGVVAFLCLASALTDLRPLQLLPGTQLLEYREGVADSVAVIGNPDGHRILRINNRFTMGGTASTNAERRHAHLPLLLHPAPHAALFLGAGTGISCGAMTAYSTLRGDAVELLPEVAQVMARFEPENARRDWAPRLNLTIADARRFVRTTTNAYDVIVADLFHPARDGAGSLYTLEHFRGIRSRLASGGLFCQWLPLYQLDEDTLRTITATFLGVFPEAHAFLLRLNLDTPVVGLVGALFPMSYAPDWVEQRCQDPTLRQALQPLGLTDTLPLLGMQVAGPASLRSFAAGAPLNTDDAPVVMFRAPRFAARHGETSYGRLFRLLEQSRDESAQLFASGAKPESAARLSAYVRARNLYLRGLKAEIEGRADSAQADFLSSARTSPDFSTGYAHCLTLAAQQAKTAPQAARALLEQLIQAQPERPVARQLLERLLP